MGIFGSGPRNLINESALIFGAFNSRLSLEKPTEFILYQGQPLYYVGIVLSVMRHDDDGWTPVSDPGA